MHTRLLVVFLLLSLLSAAVGKHAPHRVPPAHRRGLPVDMAPRATAGVLTVNATAPKHSVSPYLWSAFFEEANHAGYGGLYSQLIQTATLNSTLDPWVSAGGCAKVSLDSAQPLNHYNPNSLLVVPAADDTCAVRNPGYFGIAVSPRAAYALTLHAHLWSAAAASTLTVGLCDSQCATVYATQTVQVAGTAWGKYTATLHVDESVTTTDPTGQFFIRVSDQPVSFQTILLYPEEHFQGLPYIRKDLGDMVNALHPGMLRFPGGCYVEGDTYPTAYRWKNGIGPLEERVGLQNTAWYYWSPNFFGFLEFLEFSAALGAEPMWVVNCGMTHHGMTPLDQLQPFIDDAVDSIEFANGPVSSKWGAVRAAMGHPAPFALRYVAIGNEEDQRGFLADYKLRFPLFQRALAANFSYLRIIANSKDVQDVAPLDIYEYHWYTDPATYIQNVHHFDSYPRTDKVFNSEYAVALSDEKNYFTFNASLGEAAWMIGLEWNSDVVLMSSYAPLFDNVNGVAWKPDAIVFNTAQSYGTPSYYLQSLFSSHKGADALAFTQTGATTVLVSPTVAYDRARGGRTQTQTLILKSVNHGDAPYTLTVTVQLPTATASLSPTVASFFMTATRYDSNSFEQPTRVAPAARSVLVSVDASVAGQASFAYTFAAVTIDVLELTVLL